jgi:hypothetical protein
MEATAMAVLLRPLLLFSLILALAACGGGGGSGGGSTPTPEPEPGPTPPSAVASANATEIKAGEDTVTLDGSASSSENGSITSWQWNILSQPEDSEAIIENADASEATFSPDLPGTYVIQLEVNDGTLAYHWELTQKPLDSTAELDQGNLIYPRFDADLVGEYQAQLVVEYNGRMSSPATTTIKIVNANAIPVAKVMPQEEEVIAVSLAHNGQAGRFNGGTQQYHHRPDQLCGGFPRWRWSLHRGAMCV